MHSSSEYGTSGVPAFLHKLWTLVDDDFTDELIAWDPSGNSFHVFDQGRFSKEVLPQYFKHSNIASFIRQLNMYGFRKVASIEHGGLKTERDDVEFVHPYFQRGQEILLEQIKRKVATSKSSEEVKIKPDHVNKVLLDVHSLRGKQDNMTTKLDVLERENEALWREVAGLRQKHHKQQQIVNKLIQFLVTLVGQNRGLSGMKRRMPLMLNNANQLDSGQRPPKIARQYSYENVQSNASDIDVIPRIESPVQVNTDKNQTPGGGVTIQEMLDPAQTIPTVSVIPGTTISVTETSPQKVLVLNSANVKREVDVKNTAHTIVYPTATSTEATTSMPFTTSEPSIEFEVEPNVLASFDDDDNAASNFGGIETPASVDPVLPSYAQFIPNTTTTVALPAASTGHNNESISEVSEHIDTMQDSLEGLKDLLSGSGISLDPSTMMGLRLEGDTLLGLFTPEAPVPRTPDVLVNLGDSEPNFLSSAGNISGNELIQYNPVDEFGSLFDLDLESTLADDDDLLQRNDPYRGDLETPSMELTSPLAQRRKNSNVISTEEID